MVFHKFFDYDDHFIETDIAMISKEKFISFNIYVDEVCIQFRFIDAFRFMASSLHKLASYLPEYSTVQSQFPELNDGSFSLLTKKAVMLYDYIDSYRLSKHSTDEPKIIGPASRLEMWVDTSIYA